jgi:hypothetical protein
METFIGSVEWEQLDIWDSMEIFTGSVAWEQPDIWDSMEIFTGSVKWEQFDMQSAVRYQTNRVTPIDHTAVQNEVKVWLYERDGKHCVPLR